MDYSRFDHIEVSSDEEEPRRAQVTRFEGPQSITFGGRAVGSPGAPIVVEPQPPKAPKVSTPVEVDESLFYMNGLKKADYFWGQTVEDLVITVEVAPDFKGSQVKIQLSACGQQLRVTLGQRMFFQEDTLFYPVSMERLDGEDDPYEWELVTLGGRKFFQLKLYKSALPPNLLQRFSRINSGGIAMWWPYLLTNDKEERVDVQGIQGRLTSLENQTAMHELFQSSMSTS